MSNNNFPSTNKTNTFNYLKGSVSNPMAYGYGWLSASSEGLDWYIDDIESNLNNPAKIKEIINTIRERNATNKIVIECVNEIQNEKCSR